MSTLDELTAARDALTRRIADAAAQELANDLHAGLADAEFNLAAGAYRVHVTFDHEDDGGEFPFAFLTLTAMDDADSADADAAAEVLAGDFQGYAAFHEWAGALSALHGELYGLEFTLPTPALPAADADNTYPLPVDCPDCGMTVTSAREMDDHPCPERDGMSTPRVARPQGSPALSPPLELTANRRVGGLPDNLVRLFTLTGMGVATRTPDGTSHDDRVITDVTHDPDADGPYGAVTVTFSDGNELSLGKHPDTVVWTDDLTVQIHDRNRDEPWVTYRIIDADTCRNCDLDIVFGAPHDADEPSWLHDEHGGMHCGELAEGHVAEPSRQEPTADAGEWTPRSDKARKQAITAVTLLRPDLNRRQATDLLRTVRRNSTQPEAAVANAYATSRPTHATRRAAAALAATIGTTSGVLAAANPVDGAAWVAGGSVVLHLVDGRTLWSGATTTDAESGQTSGGWTNATLFAQDGQVTQTGIATGLPMGCADPLRIARALVKIATEAAEAGTAR